MFLLCSAMFLGTVPAAAPPPAPRAEPVASGANRLCCACRLASCRSDLPAPSSAGQPRRGMFPCSSLLITLGFRTARKLDIGQKHAKTQQLQQWPVPPGRLHELRFVRVIWVTFTQGRLQLAISQDRTIFCTKCALVALSPRRVKQASLFC